jgi:CRP-like cAMP-binding protein
MNSLNTKTFNSEIKYGSFQKMPGWQTNVSKHKFNKGQIIFYEGHLPYGIFILLSGEIELKYGNSNLERVSSPALLGSFAFINNTVYSGTARAFTACETYFLSILAFQDLVEKNDSFVKFLTS